MNVVVCKGVCLYMFHIPGCMFGGGVCLAGRLLMCNRVCVCNTAVCGRRLVNGAVTSGVTSLITSVTFSQMSFLCD